MEEYLKRIDDVLIVGDYKDGEILQHTDMNTLIDVFKEGINANYEDLQKVVDGSQPVGSATKVDGASIFRTTDGDIDASDASIPTSGSVLKAIEKLKPVKGVDYYTEQDKEELVNDAAEAILDESTNQIGQMFQQKTEEFNTNAVQKTSDFDNHVEQQKSTFTEYTSEIIDKIDAFDTENLVAVHVVEEYPDVQEDGILYIKVGV